LPTSFALNNLVVGTNSNSSVSWTYDYYNDGRQRHALGSYDDRFDQLLEYDQVGRLKQAFSGVRHEVWPLRLPIPDSPYQQTYQYNAFDERTQKSGRYWRTAQSGASPCIPRQVNDTCDAEGNVVNAIDLHRYDAAGKQVHFEKLALYSRRRQSQPSVDSGAVIDQTYDADGQPAKRVETRRVDQPLNGGPETTVVETTTTTYYLYSSVLGGAKVVELDANREQNTGIRLRQWPRLAKQMVQGRTTSSGTMLIPALIAGFETGTGRVPEHQEMDPDGADVGYKTPGPIWFSRLNRRIVKLSDEQHRYTSKEAIIRLQRRLNH
jgi:hypothetical protein